MNLQVKDKQRQSAAGKHTAPPLPGLTPELAALLGRAPKVTTSAKREVLIELALGGTGSDTYDVVYDVPGKGAVTEATVVRCRNGLAVNYPDPKMRRRDPDCMVIADDGPTDKPQFKDRFGIGFDGLRGEILAWLESQELIVLPFRAGGNLIGYDALLVAPANAAFFAAALGDLQGKIPGGEVPADFSPRAVIYLAPPFRHTHCKGEQIVVHNRTKGLHEIFSLNLYPGPSAKKGVYGVLLSIGETEGWLTAHGSVVQVVTPYDNVVTIMHEGASGSGKSEMLEYPHREFDGRLLLGENVVTKERRRIVLNQGCELRPVTDDMALSHPSFQGQSGKLQVSDAEDAWFVRVDHIDHYGVDPHLERLTLHPPKPLIFLNLEAVPNSSCLIWDHIEDAPGKRCPNPRVIVPRAAVPGIVDGPVEVDVRSFGVRAPPCTRENPTYGIFGLIHFLPPALAWLWRLVSPRGHANPSIIGGTGLSSEGVGSYWPFATGRRVDQANLLLGQIRSTPRTRFLLFPNQHIGAWRVGFMAQWIGREYIARRGGAKFRPDQLVPARSALLGYALRHMQVEGTVIGHWFLETNTQPEVTDEGYDAGALQLFDFFRRELTPYLDEADLDPTGRDIIRCCLDGGALGEYESLLPAA